MTRTFVGIFILGAIVAVLSCDGADRSTQAGSTGDCPIGTFRPTGSDACVIPATDQNGTPIGVDDNRCTTGQPAFPPTCVSTQGGRSYLTTTTTCVPGYRYEAAACERGVGPVGVPTGEAVDGASIFTGAAGTTAGGAGTTPAAGASGGGAGTFGDGSGSLGDGAGSFGDGAGTFGGMTGGAGSFAASGSDGHDGAGDARDASDGPAAHTSN